MALAFVLLFHIFLEGKARMAVEASVDGARERLGRARCQEVFAAFAGRDGQPLAEKLRATGRAGADYLSALYFVDGDVDRCRADEAVAAFTAPDSRVVHVCAARFAERFALKTRDGELIVIHELLHTLGLGENPPASSEISAVVRDRCGS